MLAGFTGSASGDDQSRVLIAGDSTASSYVESRAPQAGWGQVLDYYLDDDIIVVNRAVSGRSTKSYIDEGKWDALLAEMRPGDIVLISFGHNDSRDDAPERYARADGAFRANLVRFARDTMKKGAIPVILSPAARRLWEGPAMVETHGLYALNAGIAAESAPALFIDLSNLSIAYFETLGREATKADFLWLTPENANARFPDGVEDNTHFTALGACGVARVIATALGAIPETRAVVDTTRVGPDAGMHTGPRPDSVHQCAARAEWIAEGE
jgi:lysophospholipase L1-like esterase